MVPIIWDRYIAGCQLGLCLCVAFIVDRPHHLGSIYSWLLARLVSLCGIQSTGLIACWIATLMSLCGIQSLSYCSLIAKLVSLCDIQTQVGCVLVDFDSGRVVHGQIHFENLLWSWWLSQTPLVFFLGHPVVYLQGTL